MTHTKVCMCVCVCVCVGGGGGGGPLCMISLSSQTAWLCQVPPYYLWCHIVCEVGVCVCVHVCVCVCACIPFI